MELAADIKRRVLIIDDNAEVADSLGLWLTLSGHEVSIARTAAQALSMVPTIQPEIILLDIGLPDLSGFALVKELRKIPDIPKFIVAAVTGYAFGNEMNEQRLQELQIDHYFLKPIGAQRLKSIGINV